MFLEKKTEQLLFQSLRPTFVVHFLLSPKDFFIYMWYQLYIHFFYTCFHLNTMSKGGSLPIKDIQKKITLHLSYKNIL